MRAWFAVMLLAGCSLYSRDDDGPAVTSAVETKEIPLMNESKLEVILVVDNSPAMADARAHVVEQLEAAVRTTDRLEVDLEIVVMASDGTPRGRLWSRGHAETPIEDDVVGDFGDNLAKLVDVGETGANYALDTLATTYPVLPGDGRLPFVVFVLGSDDASPLPANRYEVVPNLRAAIVAPTSFPRMEQFFGSIGSDVQHLDLESDFGSQLSLAPLAWPLVGEPCFDDAPLGACTVSYRWAQGEEVIPECLHDPLARPCWTMATPPAGQCVVPEQIHIRHANEGWFWMMVDPDFPSGTELIEQCAVDR
jgi:hypothetical protein